MKNREGVSRNLLIYSGLYFYWSSLHTNRLFHNDTIKPFRNSCGRFDTHSEMGGKKDPVNLNDISGSSEPISTNFLKRFAQEL
jgi:hypothetical protein